MPKEVIAIRHGEGDHNVGGFYSATPEHPNYRESRLTPLGRSQAKNTADQLIKDGITGPDVCAVYSSPLPRAIETARIVMSSLSIPDNLLKIDRRLIESQVGEREGLLYGDFQERDFWFPDNPETFGGENCNDLVERMLSIYNEALTTHHDSQGQVLMFSHGSPIYMLIEAVLGTGKGYKLPTAGFIKLPALKHSS